VRAIDVTRRTRSKRKLHRRVTWGKKGTCPTLTPRAQKTLPEQMTCSTAAGRVASKTKGTGYTLKTGRGTMGVPSLSLSAGMAT